VRSNEILRPPLFRTTWEKLLSFSFAQHAPLSTVITRTSDVLYTNKKHPFLTKEKGFVPVGQLKPGMHVLLADGRVGVIMGRAIASKF